MQERGEVGERRVGDLRRRIDQRDELATGLEVLLEGLDFRRQQIHRRPGNHDHGRIGRHGAFLRQHERLCGEVVRLQAGQDGAVAGSLAAGRVLLAVALDEVHLPLLAGDHLDEAVGQLLLVGRDDPFGAALVVEDHGAVGLHLALGRLDVLLVQVDVVDRHLRGHVGVLVEPIAEAIELRRLVEHAHLDRRVQLLQDLACLIRQAELLVGGQVPALVTARRQVVHGNQQRQHDDDGRAGNRPQARLALENESATSLH